MVLFILMLVIGVGTLLGLNLFFMEVTLAIPVLQCAWLVIAVFSAFVGSTIVILIGTSAYDDQKALLESLKEYREYLESKR